MIDILLVIGAILLILWLAGLVFRFIVRPVPWILLVAGVILLIAWIRQQGILPFQQPAPQ